MVEYATTKSKNVFLGQIVSKDGFEIEVTFLHAFPVIEDKAWVEENQIKSVVEIPTMDNHQRYIFQQTLSVTEWTENIFFEKITFKFPYLVITCMLINDDN